ncbi:MAG: penicillin-binding protein 1C [bacterium]
MITSRSLLTKYRLIYALLVAGILFLVLLIIIPLPKNKLKPPQAYRFYDHNGQLLSMLISKDDYFRMHVPLAKIPPLFIKTLLLQEDKYFYKHIGLNPFSIIRAAVANLLSHRIVSGGSTITMQLARMLERRKRTLMAKLIEVFRALQLELRYSKNEILAYYLSLAPYGGNIEGIQAASFGYFGKSASGLSIGEIALLVGLPKSPTSYRPDRHPDVAKKVRDSILKKMLSAGFISKGQYERASLEPIPGSRYRTKNLIPHTAWYFRSKNPDRYVWQTTIDENTQKRIAKLLKSYIKTLESYNITNAATVVIENETREIRAVVGSTDYFSKKHLGANDGSRAPRSPGSTLKPFLYALALQEGLVSEKTVLYDIPINYAGYSPQNYSKNFTGLVDVHEALTESLNIVAVRLSRQLGINKFYNLLKEGGISTLDKPPDYYGLPLVLGGVEISLIELTNLYSCLANEGIYKPYKFLQAENDDSSGKKLLSKEASWLITHILTDLERPDFPESWQFSKNRSTIAWKTGTSYGHQDAWSIGYTPKYTIGVWVGNFNGTPSKGLAGSKVAAPLLFDLFQALQPTPSDQWFAKPEGIGTRKVCALSGRLPGRHCQSLVPEYYITNLDGPTSHEICEISQEISIDTRTGLQAKASTPSKYIKREVFNIWPSEIATFLLKHGVPIKKVPPYDITNMTGQKYYPPRILSPVPNTIYYRRLDKLSPDDQGIKLNAAVTNRIRKVFWFLNDKLITEADPTQDIFINPAPNIYQITLMDEVGGKDEIQLVVKDYRELDD